jgi:elongation factor Ts
MADTVNIDAKTVMRLRSETGAAMMDCKSALAESGGDIEKAKDWLRKKGKQIAEKKAERETKAGTIASYVHLGGKIGVLVELKCETDFVAKNDEFQALARDLCMQVAAARPIAVSRERVPADVIEREKTVYRESDQLKGKPAQMIDKIIEGKLEAFFKEKCLLDQTFVKDPSGKTTVRDLLQAASGKMGENIQVGRFARFELGEAIS